jgi:hypothetical protein
VILHTTQSGTPERTAGQFAITHWSVVLAALKNYLAKEWHSEP